MSLASSSEAPSFRGVFRATVSAKRKDGVTKSEFSRRFAQHGKLAGPVVVKHNGLSYIQHHHPESHTMKLKEKLGPEIAQSFVFADIDGMITLIFPTAGDLADFFRDPAHEKHLNADVADFADVAAINISVGDELVIVEDGKLKA